MIDEIGIKNFKSIVDLKLELGRVNVLIGENGCGKTNILEAITMASAASQHKLDNEYLGGRMRMTSSEFMKSGFEDVSSENIVLCTIEDGDSSREMDVNYLSEFDCWSAEIKTTSSVIGKMSGPQDKTQLSSFLVYTPEESNLRKFSDDTMIRPLGRRGEGVFKHLKELLSNGEKERIIHALNDGLSLLDWFQRFDMPKDLFTFENRLDIADKYLKSTKPFFDQQSTNEGFLYLLFYLVLFNSPKTPSFFAIDNIETSFNPKLTKRLIQHLVEVAKRMNKQVIFTTHSPYVLDGLDLSDNDQRLLVVRRNVDGHTRISRVPHRENRTLPLSEVWMSGVLGGLPDNF